MVVALALVAPAASRAATLESIAVTPAKGQTRLLTATGTYADGSVRDLSRLATWASEDAQVVKVSNASATRGRATAVRAGPAVVSARYRGVTGTTTVLVSTPALVSIANANATGGVVTAAGVGTTTVRTASRVAGGSTTVSATWGRVAGQVTLLTGS